MERFDPDHMERLLDPERKQWQDPETILDALGVQPGMMAADIGAGPGFFTLPMAKRLGPAGKVFAIDVEPRMLERLRERAAEAGLDNVVALVSEEGSFPLADETIDAALMANVLHESKERVDLLRKVNNALRRGGVVAVVEWRKERADFGPPAENRLGPDEVAPLLQEAGYEAATEFPVGVHHYGLRARKPNGP